VINNYRLTAPLVNPLAAIDKALAQIDLTPEQHAKAKSSYETVARVLADVGSLLHSYSPDIFIQGSFRLGTPIRPIQSEHFDADMVCQLNGQYRDRSPIDVYEKVWEALGQNKTYADIRSRKDRCIRLNYAESSKFHLDIIPAIPNPHLGKNAIYVPDRKLKIWSASHPIGFADEWFKIAAEKYPIIEPSSILANRAVMNEKSASVERFEEYGEFEKKPLQRIVQLLKYVRDRYYQNNANLKPSSILLTTIVTHSYERAVQSPADTLFEFVLRVIADLRNHIYVQKRDGKNSYHVWNPVNPEENFAESWTDAHYDKFTQWQAEMIASLTGIKDSKGAGSDVMLTKVGAFMEPDMAIKAATAIGTSTHTLHTNGTLKLSSTAGAIAPSLTVPKTIFYGKS